MLINQGEISITVRFGHCAQYRLFFIENQWSSRARSQQTVRTRRRVTWPVVSALVVRGWDTLHDWRNFYDKLDGMLCIPAAAAQTNANSTSIYVPKKGHRHLPKWNTHTTHQLDKVLDLLAATRRTSHVRNIRNRMFTYSITYLSTRKYLSNTNSIQ